MDLYLHGMYNFTTIEETVMFFLMKKSIKYDYYEENAYVFSLTKTKCEKKYFCKI